KTIVTRTLLVGFLKLLPILYILWRDISINYVTLFLKLRRAGRSVKYEFMLIIVNRFIKIQYFVLIERLLTEELIEKFINHIYIFYSFLITIIFNRGI
ncbi:hypothetical protein NEUTE1DRAFT_53438, partial [Neurospora tetrasperma FGSC 2508]